MVASAKEEGKVKRDNLQESTKKWRQKSKLNQREYVKLKKLNNKKLQCQANRLGQSSKGICRDKQESCRSDLALNLIFFLSKILN